MRILITGCNHTIPADAMQSAVVPATQRVTFHLTSPPARRPGLYAVPATLDAGSEGRAASFLPGREPQLAPRFGDGAFIYDATAERWIVGPSGKKPVAGAAAEQRHTQAAHKHPAGSLALSSAGCLKTAIAECLTTAFGLLVFGLIAGFFLVLA